MPKKAKKMRLIKMLKIYMVMKGITQYQLAEETGINRSTLQNILRHEAASEEMILKLVEWTMRLEQNQ